MKVKDLLRKYNGEFYIYWIVKDEHGKLVVGECVASHASFRTPSRNRDKIMECEVHDFNAGVCRLNIYINAE